MITLTQVVKTFPSAVIPHSSGGLPIEVSLIAQLGHGAGNKLFANVAARQRGHKEFIDELDEPSAKLGGINLKLNDPSSLYSFIVGPKGHPFHRHAGNRIFTAVSGSGGAQLRFSTCSDQEMAKDPENFLKSLRFINIPPDCLFTVRFGGDTWHQFSPLSRNTLHPVFFALSCHTNELGGKLSDDIKHKIENNDANIPALTEILPNDIVTLLNKPEYKQKISTVTLAVDAAANTFHQLICGIVRSSLGMIRGFLGAHQNVSGYVTHTDQTKIIKAFKNLPEESLLYQCFKDEHIDHDDMFQLVLNGSEMSSIGAKRILENVLEGFLMNPPRRVSQLMFIRNILVKPVGLRTSPLGCPVSSLLSENTKNLFAGCYPVYEHAVNEADKNAQVILGADDKHLKFRSCVSVEIVNTDTVIISLATRVICKNWFGKFYLNSIDYIHRNYISPLILRNAVDYAIWKNRFL